jgi:hypothetical protein
MTDDRPDWPALQDCEELVEEVTELQWRQVIPRFVSEEGNKLVVAEEAFQSGSDRKISVARSCKVTAADAYALKENSAGTWAVSVGEVIERSDGWSRVIDDSECPEVETPGHSYIDARVMDGEQRRRLREELARDATERGRQYPPT